MSLPKPTSNPSKDERLSQLIGLKRLERPDVEFWKEFEQEFRNKQLTSLVGVAPWYERYAKQSIVLVRKASLPSAAVASVFALTFFGVNYFQLAEEPAEANGAALAGISFDSPSEALFVVEQSKSPVVSQDQLQTSSNLTPPATYQVSVMTKSNTDTSYELRSLPVVLSPSNTSTINQPKDSEFGAKVITTGQNF